MSVLSARRLPISQRATGHNTGQPAQPGRFQGLHGVVDGVLAQLRLQGRGVAEAGDADLFQLFGKGIELVQPGIQLQQARVLVSGATAHLAQGALFGFVTPAQVANVLAADLGQEIGVEAMIVD